MDPYNKNKSILREKIKILKTKVKKKLIIRPNLHEATDKLIRTKPEDTVSSITSKPSSITPNIVSITSKPSSITPNIVSITSKP